MVAENKLITEKKCPICQIKAKPYQYEIFTLAGNELKLGFNRCRKCGLQYISPRLSEEGLKLLYDTAYMEGTVSGHYNTNEDVSHDEYVAFQRYVRKYSDGSEWKLLDVGCGVGNLLDLLSKNKSLSVEGVEFSEFAYKEAERKGHIVRKGDLLQLEYPRASFDCTTIMYVLEHVPEPFEVIKKIFTLLRPGGYLMLAVPNLRYLNFVNKVNLLRFLTGRKKTLHPQEHLQNYTPVTLRKMVEMAGFNVEFQGMATPLHTGSLLVRSAKRLAWFPLLILHKFGYTVGGIHLIARKKGGV